MSTTNLPDQGNRHFTLPPQPRPPRTEPTYPPEPPPEPAPTPFTLIAQRAERQPPKVVLTLDEAAERMRALRNGQSEDPVLKLQIVELQAKLAEQRIRIDGLVSAMESWENRYTALEKRFTAHVSHALAAGTLWDAAQPVANADRRLPKKIAAKEKRKA